MLEELNRHVARFIEARLPFAIATVIRVKGSASARPGSKALIDADGRNVCGWVGGGCAESLVREEALKALVDGQTRVIDVDLEDEVLGVGMPCGGRMDVYVEPHLPAKPLVIAGYGRVASQLAALGSLFGYDVTVHAPKADPERYPTAARVIREPWDSLRPPRGASIVVSSEHADHLPILRQALAARPSYLGLVASRRVSRILFKRLRQEGFADELLGGVRTPAGIDLGGKTLEEMTLSVMAELLACERNASAFPLRVVKDLMPVQGQERSVPPAAGVPELLVVGHGRIAEELARLATLMRWRVTVDSPQAREADFPATSCLITKDLDFSGIEIGPSTHVVIATMHKGDHLSMQKVLRDRAPYVGLVASRKRAGLVLAFLDEQGFTEARLANVHAPAGLDLGAANPAEIALSIVSEIVAVHRGGSCRPLRDVEAVAKPEPAGECLHGAE